MPSTLTIIAATLYLWLAGAFREFSSRMELNKCIDTCEKPVTALLRSKKMDFVPPYHVCLNGKEVTKCLLESKHKELRDVGKCFD
jgi:hypothetical protein